MAGGLNGKPGHTNDPAMVVVLDRSTTGEIGEHLGHRLQRGLGILGNGPSGDGTAGPQEVEKGGRPDPALFGFETIVPEVEHAVSVLLTA